MMSNVYPEMQLEDLFTIDVMEKALLHDTIPSPLTHSLQHYVETPDAVRSVLVDGIAQNKCK